MKNKILALLYLFQSFGALHCYSNCTKEDIEAWVSKNMRTTKHSFKSYHWGSRSFFSPDELLELKVKQYPFWQEIFYYFQSADNLKEEIPSYEIKLATNEPQGLKYFQTMADNYYWRNHIIENLKNPKPYLYWDIGMGFYAAIDPIQSMAFSDFQSWILLELDVPKKVNYLYVQNNLNDDIGLCGFSFAKISAENSVLGENLEKYYYETLKKKNILFIAYHWNTKSLSKNKGCKNKNDNDIEAFNFIDSSITQKKGFKLKFYTKLHAEDRQTIKDFKDLSYRISYFWNEFYQSLYFNEYKANVYNEIFSSVAGNQANLIKSKVRSEAEKEHYLKDIYSCNGVD